VRTRLNARDYVKNVIASLDFNNCRSAKKIRDLNSCATANRLDLLLVVETKLLKVSEFVNEYNLIKLDVMIANKKEAIVRTKVDRKSRKQFFCLFRKFRMLKRDFFGLFKIE